jgi:hypothetical protein
MMAAAGLGFSLALLTSAGREPRGERLERLGRAYLPELGRVYAAAWREGAGRLERGQSIASALEAVGRAWDTGRLRLFDRLVTPELAAIVPQGSSRPSGPGRDDGPKALARAWRAFAAGLDAAGR